MVLAAPWLAGRPAGGAAQPPPPPAARALPARGRRLSCLASLRPNFSPLSLRRHHVTSPHAIGWPLFHRLHIHEEGELGGGGSGAGGDGPRKQQQQTAHGEALAGAVLGTSPSSAAALARRAAMPRSRTEALLLQAVGISPAPL